MAVGAGTGDRLRGQCLPVAAAAASQTDVTTFSSLVVKLAPRARAASVTSPPAPCALRGRSPGRALRAVPGRAGPRLHRSPGRSSSRARASSCRGARRGCVYELGTSSLSNGPAPRFQASGVARSSRDPATCRGGPLAGAQGTNLYVASAEDQLKRTATISRRASSPPPFARKNRGCPPTRGRSSRCPPQGRPWGPTSSGRRPRPASTPRLPARSTPSTARRSASSRQTNVPGAAEWNPPVVANGEGVPADEQRRRVGLRTHELPACEDAGARTSAPTERPARSKRREPRRLRRHRRVHPGDHFERLRRLVERLLLRRAARVAPGLLRRRPDVHTGGRQRRPEGRPRRLFARDDPSGERSPSRPAAALARRRRGAPSSASTARSAPSPT